MTKRILALLLALVMMLALVACGGNNTQNDTVTDNTQSDAADDTVNNTQNDAADNTQDDAAGDDTQDDTAADDPAAEVKIPALNREDFTLKNVGDSFKMEVVNLVEGSTVAWSISDEAVATIAEDGTVTAVAHGNATITATVDEGGETFDLTCIVRVSAAAESGSSVDLAAFYADVTGKYELPMGLMEVSEPEMIENYFTGLAAIATKQQIVCLTMMGPMNGEIVLVEVENSADVSAVKNILQARVDYMIAGGAFYPESTEIWENSSRVVSGGNYVMLVTSASCDAIVADFQALTK